MGKRKKANSGRRKPLDPLTTLMPISIAHALKLGIVTLPRAVRVYHVAIYAAFDGNFQPIKKCIANLETLNKTFSSIPKAALRLQTWATGMEKHYGGAYYVLVTYLELLQVYHKGLTNGTDTVSTELVGNEPRPKGSSFGCEGVYFEDDNRIVARHGL
jgi:hypothetical protein